MSSFYIAKCEYKKKDFIHYYALPTNTTPIVGIANTLSVPLGTEIVQYQVLYNNNTRHTITIDNVLHLPIAPDHIFYPQQWAQKHLTSLGNTTAGITLSANNFTLRWSSKEGLHTKRIPFTTSNTGIIYTAPGASIYCAYANQAYKTSKHDNITPTLVEETEYNNTPRSVHIATNSKPAAPSPTPPISTISSHQPCYLRSKALHHSLLQYTLWHTSETQTP